MPKTRDELLTATTTNSTTPVTVPTVASTTAPVTMPTAVESNTPAKAVRKPVAKTESNIVVPIESTAPVKTESNLESTTPVKTESNIPVKSTSTIPGSRLPFDATEVARLDAWADLNSATIAALKSGRGPTYLRAATDPKIGADWQKYSQLQKARKPQSIAAEVPTLPATESDIATANKYGVRLRGVGSQTEQNLNRTFEEATVESSMKLPDINVKDILADAERVRRAKEYFKEHPELAAPTALSTSDERRPAGSGITATDRQMWQKMVDSDPALKEKLALKDRTVSQIVADAAKRYGTDAETLTVALNQRDIPIGTMVERMVDTDDKYAIDPDKVLYHWSQRTGNDAKSAGAAASAKANLTGRKDFEAIALDNLNKGRVKYVMTDEAGLMALDPTLVPQVNTPGEQGYAVAQQIIDGYAKSGGALSWWNPMEQTHRGYLKFLQDRVKTLTSRENVKPGDANYDAVSKAALNRAIAELAAAKTVGLWTSTAYLPETADPEQASFKDAVLPSLEVIGISVRRDGSLNVVTRQESRTNYFFNTMDTAQAAVSGVLRHAGDETSQQSKDLTKIPAQMEEVSREMKLQKTLAVPLAVWGLAAGKTDEEVVAKYLDLKQNAKTGVLTRDNLMNLAMESDWAQPTVELDPTTGAIERSGDWRMWVAGTGGLIGMIAFPDATDVVGGFVGDALGGIAKLSNMSKAKRASSILDDVTAYRAAADNLYRQAQAEAEFAKTAEGMNAAHARGRAMELKMQADTAWRNASSAESDLRESFPQIADELDRIDASIANGVAAENPSILDKQLASRLPVQSSENVLLTLHPSERRSVLKTPEDAGYQYQYKRMYDTHDVVKEVEKIESIDKAGGRVAALTEESKARLQKLRGIIGDVGVKNIVDDLGTAIADPEAWRKAWIDGRKDITVASGEKTAIEAQIKGAIDRRLEAINQQQRVFWDSLTPQQELVAKKATTVEQLKDAGIDTTAYGNMTKLRGEVQELRRPELFEQLVATETDRRRALRRQYIEEVLNISSQARNLNQRAADYESAINAVLTNNETRSAAAEVLRLRLRATHGLGLQPWDPILKAKGVVKSAATDVYRGTIPAEDLPKFKALLPTIGDAIRNGFLGLTEEAYRSITGNYPVSRPGRVMASKFQKHFNLSKEQSLYVATIVDSVARGWAKANGSTVDKWYKTRIADVVNGFTGETRRAERASKLGIKKSDQFIDYWRDLQTWNSTVAKTKLSDKDAAVLDELRKKHKSLEKALGPVDVKAASAKWLKEHDARYAGKLNPRVKKQLARGERLFQDDGYATLLAESTDISKLAVPDGFFSPLQRAIGNVIKKSGGRPVKPSFLMKEIRKQPGIKEDEILWSGIEEFLAGKERVGIEDVSDWLKRREPVVEVKGATGKLTPELQAIADEKAAADAAYAEAASGADRFTYELDLSPIMLNSALNHADGLLAGDVLVHDTFVPYKIRNAAKTINSKPVEFRESLRAYVNDVLEPALKRATAATERYEAEFGRSRDMGSRFGNYVAPGESSNYREIRFIQPGSEGPGSAAHQHFEKNTIAHLRTTDRVDDQGRKILFIEEAQSDWHQAGVKHGYTSADDELRREQLSRRLVELESEKRAINKEYSSLNESDPSEAVMARKQELELRYAELTNDLYDAKDAFLEFSHGSTVRRGTHSELWRELAVKQALAIAAKEGYDGVAITRGPIIQSVVGGDFTGQVEFYDTILPGTLKNIAKSAGAPMSTTGIRLGSQIDEAAVKEIVAAEKEVKRRKKELEAAEEALAKLGNMSRNEDEYVDAQDAVDEARSAVDEAQSNLDDLSAYSVLSSKVEIDELEYQIKSAEQSLAETIRAGDPNNVADYERRQIESMKSKLDELQRPLQVPFVPVTDKLKKTVDEGLPLYQKAEPAPGWTSVGDYGPTQIEYNKGWRPGGLERLKSAQTAEDAAIVLATEATDASYRHIAEKLRRLLDPNEKFSIVDRIETLNGIAAPAGVRRYATNTVKDGFASGRVEATADAGDDAMTVIHELLHSATANQLLRYEQIVDGSMSARALGLSPEAEAACKELNALFVHAKAEWNNYKIGGPLDFDFDAYGFTNVREFVAEAMSDKSFQEALKRIPSKNAPDQSMWDTFILKLRIILGLDSLPPSVLDEVIAQTSKLIDTTPGEISKLADTDRRQLAEVSKGQMKSEQLRRLKAAETELETATARLAELDKEIEDKLKQVDALAFDRNRFNDIVYAALASNNPETLAIIEKYEDALPAKMSRADRLDHIDKLKAEIYQYPLEGRDEAATAAVADLSAIMSRYQNPMAESEFAQLRENLIQTLSRELKDSDHFFLSDYGPYVGSEDYLRNALNQYEGYVGSQGAVEKSRAALLDGISQQRMAKTGLERSLSETEEKVRWLKDFESRLAGLGDSSVDDVLYQRGDELGGNPFGLDNLPPVAVDKLKRTRSATDAAKVLAEHATDPDFRLLAEKLTRVLDPKEEFEIVARLPSKNAAGTRSFAMAFAGDYIPGRVSIQKKYSASQEVVLHELVHSATVNQLRRYDMRDELEMMGEPIDLNDKAQRACRDLNELYYKAKRAAESGGMSDHYGFKDVYEFVAEALSNRKFQRELKSLDISGESKNSTWDKFVTSIMDLLGLGRDKENALSRVIEAASRLMDTTPEELMRLEDAAKKYPDSLDVLYQRGDELIDDLPDVDAASVPADAKGAVQFLSDGRAVIFAFRQPDVTTVIHELGHIFRRDLPDADRFIIEEWAGVVDGAWTVDAEEKFARGFERYMAEGRSPASALDRVFEKMKTWMREIYKAISGSSIDIDMTPEVKGVFDRLLGAGSPDNAPLNVWTHIKSELSKQGIPFNIEAGKKQIDAVGNLILPARGKVDGLSIFTTADISRIQGRIDDAAELKKAPNQPALHLDSAKGQVVESTAVDKARGFVEAKIPESAFAQAALGLMFGGDPDKKLRHMPGIVRKAIARGTYHVMSALQDSMRIAHESGLPELAKYLTGERLRYRAGRDIPSSGYNFFSGAMSEFVDFWQELSENDRRLIQAICNENVPEKMLGLDYVTKSIKKVLYDPATPDFIKNSLNVIAAIPEKAIKAGTGPTDKERQLLRLLLQTTGQLDPKVRIYNAAASDVLEMTSKGVKETVGDKLAIPGPKPGQAALDEIFDAQVGIDGIAGIDTQSADRFLTAVADIYGEPAATKMGIVLAGAGAEHRAFDSMFDSGIVLDKKDAAVFKKRLMGEHLPPKLEAKADEIAAKFGLNPMFKDFERVAGKSYVVPSVAKNRLAGINRSFADEMAAASRAGEAGVVDATKSAGERMLGNIVRYMHGRMVRGGLLERQTFYLNQVVDHMNGIFSMAGLRPAIVSTARFMAQNLLVLTLDPSNVISTGRVLHTAQLATGAEIVQAGLKHVGLDLKGKEAAVLSGASKLIQSGSDVFARALAKLLGIGKYRVEVNDVLKGGDKLIHIGGASYTADELRRIALEGELFSNMGGSAVGKVFSDADSLRLEEKLSGVSKTTATAMREIRNAGERLFETPEEIAELVSTHERIGAYVTLIEAGLTPRQAADLVGEGLLKYGSTLSPNDRNPFVKMLVPFWPYIKNANVQITNLIFSPYGAYRLGVMRRFWSGGADMLTGLSYSSQVDPYGIDESALPPSEVDKYYALRFNIEAAFGGVDKVPEEVRLALRAALAGQVTAFHNGQVFEIDDYFRRMVTENPEVAKAGVTVPIDSMRLSTASVPPPDKATRSDWMRDRDVIRVTPSLTDRPLEAQIGAAEEHAARVYAKLKAAKAANPSSAEVDQLEAERQAVSSELLALYAKRGNSAMQQFYGSVHPDHPMTEILIPDHNYRSAATWMSNMLAWQIMSVAQLVDRPDALTDDEPYPSSMDYVFSSTPLKTLVDPTRAPLTSDVLGYMGVSNSGGARRVHPALASFVESVFPIVMTRVSAEKDPFLPTEPGGLMVAASKKDLDYLNMETRPGAETPVADDPLLTKPLRYYAGGPAATLFYNTPLGEINEKMLAAETTPYETAAGGWHLLLPWARTQLGLKTMETQQSTGRRETGQREEVEWTQQSGKPKSNQ